MTPYGLRRRPELLTALLTIWRWGVLEESLPAGKPLGGFAQWCRWVRDPLLALGCRDPIERVSEAKQRDSRRQALFELFQLWWEKRTLAQDGTGKAPVKLCGPNLSCRVPLAYQKLMESEA